MNRETARAAERFTVPRAHESPARRRAAATVVGTLDSGLGGTDPPTGQGLRLTSARRRAVFGDRDFCE